MEWKDVGRKIAKAAPLLGRLVGNFVPGAGAVGSGIGLIASAFGIDADEATPDQVMAALGGDPEWFLKLKDLENTHQVQLAQLVLEQDRLFLADRQSARSADVEKTKATGTRDYAMYILAGIVCTGFFFLCGAMFWREVPESSQEGVFILFGGLNTAFATVIGYFFGSSKSSSDKTKLLSAAKG